MVVPLSKIIEEAGDFFIETAGKEKYGDITVTITLNDGVPVKITKLFCEHIARRTTTRVVVNK